VQRNHQAIVYSPQDLIQYSQSEFASWMDRFQLERPSDCPPHGAKDSLLVALCQLGQEHEQRYLKSLQEAGADVCSMIGHRGAYAATIAAMQMGHTYIYQPALKHDCFLGYADFLVRVETPSNLGHWSYVPLECKLARSPKAEFLLQTCAYCDLIEHIQGTRPSEFQLLLGDGKIQSHSTEQYFYYYQQVRKSFLEFMSAFDSDQMPLPTPGEHGQWQSYAEQMLLDRDHLSQVANITRSQISKLEEAGIKTFQQLADNNSHQTIPHLNPVIFHRLATQARLQQATIQKGQVQYQVIPLPPDESPRGLATLPPPSVLDVYFDMEGYPLVSGGLEYLFGAISAEDAQFHDWWAHDLPAEKLAFEQFIDWVYDRWQQDPQMHIYHYAAYETIALKRLMSKYATREHQVDNLLRAEVFIDLFQIVRQGLFVGQPSYSIKKLEPLYGRDRSGEVQNALDSVVQYFDWIQSSEGHRPDRSPILAEIRDYNRVDCESTEELVNWLRGLQVEHSITYVPKSHDTPAAAPENLDEADVLAAKLLATIEHQSPATTRIQTLLAHSLLFHKREAKPFWWQRFEWLETDEADLYTELDCLAGLERTDRPPFKPTPKSRSLAFEYRFDPQETKLKDGTSCWFSPEQKQKGCTLNSLDLQQGTVTISISEKTLKDIQQQEPGWEPPNRTSLVDCNFIKTTELSNSILETVKDWSESSTLQPALQNFLDRQPPRIQDVRSGHPLISKNEDLLAATIRIVANLHQSTLCIQGPPGSGKTYTCAHTILHLLKMGKSIAVCANSHQVVINLMGRVAKCASEAGFNFQAAKIGGDKEDRIFQDSTIKFRDSIKDTSPPIYQMIGATAFQFCRAEAVEKFDYLFIDEAGQMSLANLLAIARCAHNLILIGDPMQLEQPIQATHPGESGQSALNYFLNGLDTIPEHLGIFLDTSYRMHPSICQPISEAIYEGRLQSAQHTQDHCITTLVEPNGSRGNGIVFIPVAHTDNQQSSKEEVDAIEQLIAKLLGHSFTSDRGERQSTIKAEDILIVAPYNLQVRKLQDRLGNRARIGTVDKFQGQEAPILILSMSSSSSETAPRGLEFLFNRHRLNVAISRAQCLSIVVGSPALAKTLCSTLEQAQLVNLFCKIINVSQIQTLSRTKKLG
jgi:predicted RecB family nuclease